MAQRQAPTWFVRALAALNPHFSVEWDQKHSLWAIKESVRHSSLVMSTPEGAPVFRMHRRPETALRFADLGSRLLQHIRKNDPRRYRDISQMVKQLRIDDRARPQIQTSPAFA